MFRVVVATAKKKAQLDLCDSFNLSALTAKPWFFPCQIDQWLDFAQDTLSTTDFKFLDAAFRELNHHLTLRSFFVGYQVSLADFVIWGALKCKDCETCHLRLVLHDHQFYLYIDTFGFSPSLSCIW